MKIWRFGPCFYTQTLLIIIYVFPSELGSKDLNNYKNYKAYTKHYHKSGWLQPLLYQNFTCSNCCILKGEYRKSQSVNELFHKLWIILENSAKIWSCHCTCMVGIGQTCSNVSSWSRSSHWFSKFIIHQFYKWIATMLKRYWTHKN